MAAVHPATARAPRRRPLSPAPERTVRPDLRVVGPQRRRSRTGLVIATAMVVVFASLLASAVFHSVLVTGQGRLDDMQQRLDRARQQIADDRLAVAERESPARLAAAATKQGMVIPDEQTWLASPGPDGSVPEAVVTRSAQPAEPPAATGAKPAATTGTTQPTDRAGTAP